MSQSSRYRIVEVKPRRYYVEEHRAGWFTGPRWRFCPCPFPNGFSSIADAELWIDELRFARRVVKEV